MTEQRVVMIPADKLVVDRDYQARTRLDDDHVARLTFTDPETWPPLLVTPHPDQPGMYAVIDGSHRVEAGNHLANGKHVTAYPCYVVEGLGVKASFTANASHPLTICAKDRVRFALGFHEAHPNMSAREIGRRVGLSHTTVSKAITAANRGPSSGGDPDSEVAIRRVLNAVTSSFDPADPVQPAVVYGELLLAKNPERTCKAAKHWAAVLADVARRAEARF